MMVSAHLGYAITAGATALAIAFAKIDANPSLYFADLFIATDRRMNDFFAKKTMWITGASSGIGAEMAVQLSRFGVNLILSARSEEKLHSVAEACRKVSEKGNTISVLPLDVTCSDDDIESTIERMMDIIGNGSLDFVVLNAGKGQLKPARMMTRQETEEVLQLNTLAPIALTQLLLRKGLLGEDKGKNIMITSSVGGKYGLPLSASYAASKHALHGYFDSLKAECPWLRIHLVCPGSTDTAFHHSKDRHDNTREIEAKTTRRELKMPAQRCARLMVSSFLLKGGGEHWIAEQPSLLGLYLKQFFPTAFQRILCKVGPLRIKAWEEGMNLYDPQTWKDIRKRK
eukprot:scaffold1869_cov122-Cylindrotheca_fusiformis.AAC.50